MVWQRENTRMPVSQFHVRLGLWEPAEDDLIMADIKASQEQLPTLLSTHNFARNSTRCHQQRQLLLARNATKAPPRLHRRYTEDEEQIIRSMAGEGKTPYQIAEALCSPYQACRQDSALVTKMRQIGVDLLYGKATMPWTNSERWRLQNAAKTVQQTFGRVPTLTEIQSEFHKTPSYRTAQHFRYHLERLGVPFEA